jgi:glycosyltransferase involved in cell wall biosynthesis
VIEPSHQPLVSIVIDNYNYAQFLGRAIDSALSQRYRHVEVVVVDDGSTDNSAEVIARYGDRCVTVFQEQRGQGAAYNSGFAASHGDIVIFLDSDDVLYPDAAGEIAQAWAPDIAKVQFPLDAIDALERPLGHQTPNLAFADSADTLPLLLTYGYYPSPPGSGNAFSRAALERMLPADEETWRVGSDGLVIGLAPLYGRVVSLPRPLGAYRHHDRNHSEASGTNLAKIRRDLLNEVNREAAIKEHAAALGLHIEHELSLRIPGHCKGRLLSLRLAAASHPFPEDGTLPLALAGILACWRFPHHDIGKRVAASLAFALLPVVPKWWLERNLDGLIIARRREGLLRHLLPANNDEPVPIRRREPGLAPLRRPAVQPAEARVRSRGNS